MILSRQCSCVSWPQPAELLQLDLDDSLLERSLPRNGGVGGRWVNASAETPG